MAERAARRPGGTSAEVPRLLPWTTQDGHPCYLSTDGQRYIANLADNIEATQMGMGEDLLEYVRDAVAPDAKALSATEYRGLVRRLTEALSDALRVADSRGQRLPAPEEGDRGCLTP